MVMRSSPLISPYNLYTMTFSRLTAGEIFMMCVASRSAGRLITGLKEFDVLTLLSFHSNIRRVLCTLGLH